MLRRSREQLGIWSKMFVAEREPKADTGKFQEERDLLKPRASNDSAACISDDFGGSMCIIYACHF